MGNFANWKKIILFGVIGAVGCLIGGLLGELFLGWAQPQQRDGNNAGGLIFNADLSARLQREHAQSGDVQISLMWNNQNDLDLHVIDPAGEAIFFKRRKSSSGGELDVDMNADPRKGLSNQPVENVYWPSGGAPNGNYKVYVNYYLNHGAPDPTDFIVGVSVGWHGKHCWDRTRRQGIHWVHLVQGKTATNLRIYGRALCAAEIHYILVHGTHHRPVDRLARSGAILCLGRWPESLSAAAAAVASPKHHDTSRGFGSRLRRRRNR